MWTITFYPDLGSFVAGTLFGMLVLLAIALIAPNVKRHG